MQELKNKISEAIADFNNSNDVTITEIEINLKHLHELSKIVHSYVDSINLTVQ